MQEYYHSIKRLNSRVISTAKHKADLWNKWAVQQMHLGFIINCPKYHGIFSIFLIKNGSKNQVGMHVDMMGWTELDFTPVLICRLESTGSIRSIKLWLSVSEITREHRQQSQRDFGQTNCFFFWWRKSTSMIEPIHVQIKLEPIRFLFIMSSFYLSIHNSFIINYTFHSIIKCPFLINYISKSIPKFNRQILVSSIFICRLRIEWQSFGQIKWGLFGWMGRLPNIRRHIWVKTILVKSH